MKPRRDITPYMGSTDSGVNASLTLGKLFKRLRTIDPAHKPGSRHQARLKNKRAARKMKCGIVR